MSKPVRHFLDLWKLDGKELRIIREEAKARKAAQPTAMASGLPP